ncbi:MAG: M24 family metallopeptidase, partial [Kiritimatiellia bacterium]|nr:M24 family metallopeptidase [Kiritimatiellia bacterium]
AAFSMIAGAKIARNRSLKIGNKPLTSAAVRDRIDNTARDFGCVCYGTIVAGGRQAVNPHETGWGTLKADEPIVIDIFPQHIKSGYWGDLTRTIVRGTPSPEIQKMYSAVRDAQKTAISKIKPGVTAKKIHNIAVDLFKERGFFTGAKNGKQVGFIHGIGHGIGFEIHENPSVRPVETKLKEGNVITIEPGLYYHSRGAIRIEDVVLVTRAGGRILAPYDYPFIIT